MSVAKLKFIWLNDSEDDNDSDGVQLCLSVDVVRRSGDGGEEEEADEVVATYIASSSSEWFMWLSIIMAISSS